MPIMKVLYIIFFGVSYSRPNTTTKKKINTRLLREGGVMVGRGLFILLNKEQLQTFVFNTHFGFVFLARATTI